MTFGFAMSSETKLSGSFASPKYVARRMQVVAHIGSCPFSTRCRQKWHFRALPIGESSFFRYHLLPYSKDGASSYGTRLGVPSLKNSPKSNVRALYGHAVMQYRQPIHLS